MNNEIKLGKDMTPKLIGETYMKYPSENSTQRYSYGIYECQYCGAEFEAMTKHIKSGNTKSCGCLYEGHPTHGLKSNRFYNTWAGMIHRCTNPKSPSFKNYGARGITVCEEWLDVTNFITWCESTYIKGMTMDRINNDGNYEPTNIRWADKTTQALNKRIGKNNTSGYVGVSWHKGNNKWAAQIKVNNKPIKIGSFLTIEEAVLARNNYIIENKLPHKLSTDYKKEK